jgi:hypothetical protein
MSRAFPLAGFEVTINGRIWVIPEGLRFIVFRIDGKQFACRRVA